MKTFKTIVACSAALIAAIPMASSAQTTADTTEKHAHVMHSPEAVLTAYRDALVALDLEAAGVNFAEDSSIFENGKPEGNWANYAEKHLGPELGHFHSFTFPAYDVDLRQDGHYAFGEERYTYRIELHDGRIVEREGVATSVLHHTDDGWKIIVYHSSGRPPKRS